MGSKFKIEEKSGRQSINASDSLNSEILLLLRQRPDFSGIASPFLVTGKSGVKHSFTLGLGSALPTPVVCDVVVASAPVDETKVLSLFIKVYDVGAKHAILCVVPGLTPEAKKLSAMYKITVVEASKREDLSSNLSEVLHRIIRVKS